MHGKFARDFQEEVTGGCEVKGITNRYSYFDSGLCSVDYHDSNRKVTGGCTLRGRAQCKIENVTGK